MASRIFALWWMLNLNQLVHVQCGKRVGHGQPHGQLEQVEMIQTNTGELAMVSQPSTFHEPTATAEQTVLNDEVKKTPQPTHHTVGPDTTVSSILEMIVHGKVELNTTLASLLEAEPAGSGSTSAESYNFWKNHGDLPNRIPLYDICVENEPFDDETEPPLDYSNRFQESYDKEERVCVGQKYRLATESWELCNPACDYYPPNGINQCMKLEIHKDGGTHGLWFQDLPHSGGKDNSVEKDWAKPEERAYANTLGWLWRRNAEVAVAMPESPFTQLTGKDLEGDLSWLSGITEKWYTRASGDTTAERVAVHTIHEMWTHFTGQKDTNKFNLLFYIALWQRVVSFLDPAREVPENYQGLGEDMGLMMDRVSSELSNHFDGLFNGAGNIYLCVTWDGDGRLSLIECVECPDQCRR